MIAYPTWYKLPEVKFEMISFLKNREVAFIKPNFSTKKGKTIRMLRMHNVQSIDLWANRMHISNNGMDYNMYYSLAKYKNGIPFTDLTLRDRDFTKWNNDCWKEIISYDFLIDIDSGNHSEIEFAYYSTLNIKEYFDELNIPYNLRFSGMGFHFIIPHEFFDNHNFNPNDDKNVYYLYMAIAQYLHSKFSEMIDLNIYDYRRVTKIPYSLALYKDKCYVCLPFNSDKEFELFNLKNMNPAYFLNKIRGRSEKLFNKNGNLFKLKEDLGI